MLKPPSPLPQTPRPSAPAGTTARAPATPAPSPRVTEEGPATQPGPPLPVVALDAGHGGDDAGGRSREGVSEKDFVAQLVAHVRLALLSTGKYRIVLTRTGDVNATFEQRTVAANVGEAVYFLTFHAGDLGGNSPRIAVYTYQSPNPPLPSVGGEARSIFVTGDQVQETYLDRSRQLAQALAQQFAQIAGVTADTPTAAPARMPRSVNAPAVAIEVGSLSPDNDAAPDRPVISTAPFCRRGEFLPLLMVEAPER